MRNPENMQTRTPIPTRIISLLDSTGAQHVSSCGELKIEYFAIEKCSEHQSNAVFATSAIGHLFVELICQQSHIVRDKVVRPGVLNQPLYKRKARS